MRPGDDPGEGTVNKSDEHIRLIHELMTAGWSTGDSAYSTYGVTLTVRKWPYTSSAPGVPEFAVHGEDRIDAIRNALEKIREQEAPAGDGSLGSHLGVGMREMQ